MWKDPKREEKDILMQKGDKVEAERGKNGGNRYGILAEG